MKKKRRSIRAARGRSRSGHAWRHWLLGPSDPAREEKRVHANGTRASFFLPLFSETLAQAGLLAKACKTTQGQQQQGGNEREMAGTPRSRQVPSCPAVLGQGLTLSGFFFFNCQRVVAEEQRLA
jgi:hypothetical protein